MGLAPAPGGPADRLVAALHHGEQGNGLADARMVLAAAVAAELALTEPVAAAIVVGSTALRRCSPRADLDIVVITAEAAGDDRFTTRWDDGTRVEIERLGRDDAMALTAGPGWVWELRNAARLGTGIPVFDPERFGAALAVRAAAMAPSAERLEATLRSVYDTLIELGGDAGGPAPDRRLDALRGCLDNLGLLALLEHPRRYQKPKWVLADLLHASEFDLVDALLVAYGIGDGDETAIAGTRHLIDEAYAIAGVPAHDDLLARGHAPEWAEASYVSRTLDDAEDLAASGRMVEAQYTALFAARLVAGVLGTEQTDDRDVVETFAAHELDCTYIALFPAPAADDHDLLVAALAAARDRRRALESSPA